MFSVVILSKTVTNLVPCVEAVFRNEPSLSRHRIIVIDDGIEWTDDIRAKLKGVWVIPGIAPFVFSRNANIGLAAAGRDDIILLNDDAILDTIGGFTAMAEQAEKHPEVGLIGAVTNLTGQPLQQPRGIGLRGVPHFAFVCVLIPRRTIESVGFLDERYCLDYGCEDRDYCEAVRAAGMQNAVYDFCYVDHGSLKSTYRGDPKAPKSFAQNFALLEKKWGKIAC